MTNSNDNRTNGAAGSGSKLGTNTVYTQFDRIGVKINAQGTVARTFIDAYISVFTGKLAMSGSELPFSEEKLRTYLEYAIFARVKQCNGEKCLWRSASPYHVPAFLVTFLSQIGNAKEQSLGIELYPEWDGDEPEMTEMELQQISFFVGLMDENHNMTTKIGLPASKEGAWLTMSFEFSERRALALTNAATNEQATIASFFSVNGIATVLGLGAFRVNYGHEDTQLGKAFGVVNG